MNYFFIDLQTKQCCDKIDMKKPLCGGLVLFSFRCFLTASPWFYLYSQFSMNTTTVFISPAPFLEFRIDCELVQVSFTPSWYYTFLLMALMESTTILKCMKLVCRRYITCTHGTLRTHPKSTIFLICNVPLQLIVNNS